MSKKKLFFYVGVFLLSVAAGFTFFRSSNSGTLSSAPELDWRALGEMDYISGAASDDLKKLDGKTVKIPGFMVPLEDNQKLVSQFLLVPSPQACIHVPPPPPNQMVLIDMDPGSKTETASGPIWVYGKFEITSKRHMYGESSFHMVGFKVEPYR